MIACLDVHYWNASARAACVLLADSSDCLPVASQLADVNDVEPYQPGSFYLRELPCLLAVLRLLTTTPAALVVDGYVWISPEGKPGLGAHLHDAIGRAAPVVGVAKTQFMTFTDSTLVVPVQRGASTRPLFVTSV